MSSASDMDMNAEMEAINASSQGVGVGFGAGGGCMFDTNFGGSVRSPVAESPIPWGNHQHQHAAQNPLFPSITGYQPNMITPSNDFDRGRATQAVTIPRPTNPNAGELERQYDERRANDDRNTSKKRKSSQNYLVKDNEKYTTTPLNRSRSNSNASNGPWSPSATQSPTLNHLNSARNRLNIAPLKLTETTPANSPNSTYYCSGVDYGSPSNTSLNNPSASCSPTLGLAKFRNDHSAPSSVSSSLSKSPGDGFGLRKWAHTNDRNSRESGAYAQNNPFNPPIASAHLNAIRPAPLVLSMPNFNFNAAIAQQHNNDSFELPSPPQKTRKPRFGDSTTSSANVSFDANSCDESTSAHGVARKFVRMSTS